jgi:hypothetical protein
MLLRGRPRVLLLVSQRRLAMSGVSGPPPPPPEERKALRVARREAKVGTVLRVWEKTKETSYMAVGVVGCALIVAVTGLLVYKKFSGDSEYVVFEKTLALLKESEALEQQLGAIRHAYGERSEGLRGGHHAGIRHQNFVNPATGERHVQVEFHIYTARGERPLVRAEMAETRGAVRSEWRFVTVAAEWQRGGKGRLRRLQVYPPLPEGPTDKKRAGDKA